MTNTRGYTDLSSQTGSVDERVVISKIARHILPFVFLLYILAYLDRVNVSFAALQMKQQLRFSDTVYGFGSGIFFIGYFLFEVPSNLILERVGARVWIARIMITWGMVSTLTMFVRNPTQFYTARFLLGVAEAGFFPGMLLYFTYWFPPAIHGRVVSFFMTALAVSGVVGPPVSGLLLKLNGTFGLAGWQWVFLAEGIPSILVGVLVLRILQDRPENALWLSNDERSWLNRELSANPNENTTHHGLRVFRFRIVWLLSAIYFLIAMALNGLNFWLPQIVAAPLKGDVVSVSLLATLPYFGASIGMVYWGSRSDHKRERHFHLIGAAAFGAVGMVLVGRSIGTFSDILGLCIAATGTFAALGPFWSLCSSYLPRAGAAAGLAFINSVGNLGGFFGPYLMGVLKTSDDYQGGLLLLAGSLICLAPLVLVIRRRC